MGHRLRPRPLYLSALALFVFGNVLAALSPSFTLLFLARVMMACASAVVCVLATTLATELVPPSLQGRAIGLIFMGISGSLVLGVSGGNVNWPMGRLADRLPAPLALNLVAALYLGSLVSLPFLLNHLPWLGSFMVLIWFASTG
ncbi:hypothetical protein N879_13430 [Alcaligenes sp. EGD-AK7]|nr:hypothetical protein N879_13430 [Alcaligenes sp. EGD-AK7]